MIVTDLPNGGNECYPKVAVGNNGSRTGGIVVLLRRVGFLRTLKRAEEDRVQWPNGKRPTF